MIENHPRTIVVLVYGDGAESGFAAGLHASAGPCRFKCIASDATRRERLYVVAPIDAGALENLVSVCGGSRYFMPHPELMKPAQTAALEELLIATEDALTSPAATMVFANHIDTVPHASISVAGVETRVRAALLNEDPAPLSDWMDIRERCVEVDWLDAIQMRADVATPGPWISYIEGRDFWGGGNLIKAGDEDFEFIGPTHADQDFMAHARHDIPRLIEEVRRLRKLAS